MSKLLAVELQGGIRVIPILADNAENPCAICAFQNSGKCDEYACNPDERKDGKDVFFILTPEEEELDPSGKSQHEAGAKLDAGKLRPSLIIDGMARALMAVAEVGTIGAIKYSTNGWLTVSNGQERYNDAMQRHILAEATGEKYDNGPGGTGLRHAAQVAWNALAKLDLAIREDEDASKVY